MWENNWASNKNICFLLKRWVLKKWITRTTKNEDLLAALERKVKTWKLVKIQYEQKEIWASKRKYLLSTNIINLVAVII